MAPRSSWALVLLLLASCSSSSPPAGGSDAGPENDASSNRDSGAAPDVAIETSVPPDVGTDAAPDVASDVANDVARDVGADSPIVFTDGGAPLFLSQTGLYSDISGEVLAPGVESYEPQFPLWSDSASKRRWLWLPPGTQIDTSSMDFWSYPIGTKVWKEFTRDGTRVETRLLEKRGDDDWLKIAYLWNATQTDAMAVPSGMPNALGTEHDVPSQSDCDDCHESMDDRLLSVTAIQLDHSLGGLTVQSLVSDGRLSDPPSSPFVVPGDATAKAALGYLHSNCGSCHNERSPLAFRINMDLWLDTASLSDVTTTSTYSTTVGVVLQSSGGVPGTTMRIVAGMPDASAVHVVMSSRGGTAFQMPPLATEVVDDTGLAAVRAWILGL